MSDAHVGGQPAIQLRAYEPDGPALMILPEPQGLQFAGPLSDVSSLIFSYRKDAPGAEVFLRPDGVEIAVEIFIPQKGTWVEPPNCRFVVLDWEDDAADDSNVMKFTAPGYAWLMSKQLIRKGKNDDRLNAAEAAAKADMDEKRRAYDSAMSAMNSIITRVRNLSKMRGMQVMNRGFPTRINGKKPTHASVMWNTRYYAWYWFNANVSKWYKMTGSAIVETIPDMITKYEAMIVARDAHSWAKIRHDKAAHAAREATKGGKRPMVATTAGWAMLRHLNETRSYGGNRLKGMGWSFNGTYADGNKKWSQRFNLDLTIGMSLLDLLKQLAEMGTVEWFMHGRTLRMYRPGDYAADLSQYIALRPGLDVSEAPERSTRRDYANYLLVRAEGDLTFGLYGHVDDGYTGWGAWEQSVSVSGASTVEDAKVLALNEARTSLRKVRVESTRALTLSPGSPIPLYDYLPGQYIRAQDSTGRMARVRVMQITLAMDNEGRVTGALVLGDRFMQQALNFQRGMARTVGGYEKAIGGGTVPLLPSNTTPAEQVEDEGMILSLGATARAGVDPITGSPVTLLTLAWQPGGPVDIEVLPEEEEDPDATSPDEFMD